MKKYFILFILLTGCNGIYNISYYDSFDQNTGLSKSYEQEYYEKYNDFFEKAKIEYKAVKKRYEEQYGEKGTHHAYLAFLEDHKDYISLDNYSKKRYASYIHPANAITMESENCIYILAYLIPLNFWDIHPTKVDIKKLLDKAKTEGLEGNTMKHISITNTGFITPVISFTCFNIKGAVN